jgi:hypothetical protein
MCRWRTSMMPSISGSNIAATSASDSLSSPGPPRPSCSCCCCGMARASDLGSSSTLAPSGVLPLKPCLSCSHSPSTSWMRSAQGRARWARLALGRPWCMQRSYEWRRSSAAAPPAGCSAPQRSYKSPSSCTMWRSKLASSFLEPWVGSWEVQDPSGRWRRPSMSINMLEVPGASRLAAGRCCGASPHSRHLVGGPRTCSRQALPMALEMPAWPPPLLSRSTRCMLMSTVLPPASTITTTSPSAHGRAMATGARKAASALVTSQVELALVLLTMPPRKAALRFGTCAAVQA